MSTMNRGNGEPASNFNAKEGFIQMQEEAVSEIDNVKYFIGSWDEAAPFQRDNEFIQGGYRINFCTVGRILRSLFMCHNETTNIWSHLCGFLLFIVFIVYIGVGVTPTRVFSPLDVIRGFFNSSLLNVSAPNNWTLSNYSEPIQDKTELWAIEKINQSMPDITAVITNYSTSIVNTTKPTISQRIDFLFQHLEDIFVFVKDRVFEIINNHTQRYRIRESEIYVYEIPKWPLYLHMAGAITCLVCSTMFHLWLSCGPTVQTIMSRFDYSGISFMIAGSTCPPLIYGYACAKIAKLIYLLLTNIFCFLAFAMTMFPGLVNPKFRFLRGIVYILVGLLAGAPCFQAFFVEDKSVVIRVLYWAIGGGLYVGGALLYVMRIPERWFPGKFDYFGHGHNWFHIFVLIAAILHFIGSLECYQNRVNNLCDQFIEDINQ